MTIKHRLPLDIRCVYGMSWSEIIGKRMKGSGWPPLSRLQAAVSRLGIRMLKQYQDAYHRGQLKGFPAHPPQAYQTTWSNIVKRRGKGAEWPPLSSLQAAVSRLGVTTMRQYDQIHREGKLDGFPLQPIAAYQVRWAEIVGTRGKGTGWPPLSKLQTAVSRLGIHTVEQYKRSYRDGRLDGFPSHPVVPYRVKWAEILGKRKKGTGWPPFTRFRAVVIELGIQNRKQYLQAHREGQLEEFPADPTWAYGTKWSKLWPRSPK